ncbi:MAG: response regulator [Nitrospinae bacterium]|nr:response regulator [Nitrospinota bacterium]
MAKILVVDDEKMILDIIDNLLTSEGHEITLLQKGEEAITTLCDDASCFDLMLLDLGLPEMTGIEVLEHLEEKNIQLPKTIILTGMMEVDIYVRAKELGACEYITKPFDIETFVAIVNSNLAPTKQD